MLNETKTLIKNLDKKFLRKYQWRYHILIVDNHFFNCYSFFLQARKNKTNLLYSYDLVEFKHDEKLYRQVLKEMKEYSKLSIEFRDTNHLVHPGADISNDLIHGHNN